MIPLSPAAIRARKRPLAVLCVYLAEIAWALVVAAPVHTWARRVWGAHPDGDAVLWLPGGRDLVTWFGQEDAALSVVTRTALVLLVVGALAMQVPLGALIASLAFSREPGAGEMGGAGSGRSPRWSTAVRVGTSAFVPLAGLLALGTIASGLVFVVGTMASSAVGRGLTTSLGDARAFTVHLVVLALFVVVAALIGIIVDLARAAIPRDVGLAIADAPTAAWTTMMGGIRIAFTVARRNLRTAAFAWAWRALLGLLLIGAGLAVSQALGGRGGGLLLLLWLAHQAIVLARVALRASWLARAVALVAPVQDARRAVPQQLVTGGVEEPS